VYESCTCLIAQMLHKGWINSPSSKVEKWPQRKRPQDCYWCLCAGDPAVLTYICSAGFVRTEFASDLDAY